MSGQSRAVLASSLTLPSGCVRVYASEARASMNVSDKAASETATLRRRNIFQLESSAIETQGPRKY